MLGGKKLMRREKLSWLQSSPKQPAYVLHVCNVSNAYFKMKVWLCLNWFKLVRPVLKELYNFKNILSWFCLQYFSAAML